MRCSSRIEQCSSRGGGLGAGRAGLPPTLCGPRSTIRRTIRGSLVASFQNSPPLPFLFSLLLARRNASSRRAETPATRQRTSKWGKDSAQRRRCGSTFTVLRTFSKGPRPVIVAAATRMALWSSCRTSSSPQGGQHSLGASDPFNGAVTTALVSTPAQRLVDLPIISQGRWRGSGHAYERAEYCSARLVHAFSLTDKDGVPSVAHPVRVLEL